MVHKFPVVDCEAHFLSKKGLDNHLRLHNNKKGVFLCNVCGLDFDSLSKLKYHKISHSATKKHKCTWCCSKFGQKSDRKRHQLSSCKSDMHTKFHQQFQKVKNRKSTNHKCRLRKRLMKVLFLLPFTCAICHQRFENRESVHKHMGSAHKCSSIFPCLDCCFTFCSQKMLYYHKADSNCKHTVRC